MIFIYLNTCISIVTFWLWIIYTEPTFIFQDLLKHNGITFTKIRSENSVTSRYICINFIGMLMNGRSKCSNLCYVVFTFNAPTFGRNIFCCDDIWYSNGKINYQFFVNQVKNVWVIFFWKKKLVPIFVVRLVIFELLTITVEWYLVYVH